MNFSELIKESKENNETELEIDPSTLSGIDYFPCELFDISTLEVLRLDDCFNNIEIKESDFNNLPNLKNLKELSLNTTGLRFIPRQLEKLKNLEILYVFGNKINKIPAELSNCKKLKELHFSINNISEIPKFIFELQNIEVLDIAHNPIKILPKEIGQLEKLKSLWIQGTKIENLPIQILALELEEFAPDDTLIEIPINDKGGEPMFKESYIKLRLEFYFREYKSQLKKKLKRWLANHQINKVFEVLTSEMPEFNYYEISKDVIMTSSRYRHLELEKRRGVVNYENEKIELAKIIDSLIGIVNEL